MSGAVTATAIAVGLTTTELFTAVAVVGAVVGVVGTVTKSKELQYAGMALGAVGAVGGLASSAGLFAADAFATGTPELAAGGMGALQSTGLPGAVAGFETTATAGAGMADVLSSGLPGATAGFDTMSNVPGSVIPAEDLITMASGLPSTSTASLPGAVENAAPPSIPGATDTPVTRSGQVVAENQTFDQAAPAQTPPWTDAKDGMGQVQSVDPAAGPVAPKANVPTEPTAPTPSVINGTPNGPGSGVPTGGPGSLTSGGGFNTNPDAAGLAAQKKLVADDPSIWSKIFNVIKEPGVGMLGFGAIQAGGAFLGGALSTKTPAEVKALEAQAGYNVAAANLANQQATLLQNQQANLSGGIPVARNPTPPVTGAPTGLINRAPTPAPVTGVPA